MLCQSMKAPYQLDIWEKHQELQADRKLAVPEVDTRNAKGKNGMGRW